MRSQNFATGLLIVAVLFFVGIREESNGARGAEPKKVAPEVSIDTGFDHSYPHSVALSPDGKYVIAQSTGKEDNLAIWEVATGKRLTALSKQIGSVLPVAIAPDGKTFAHADYSSVRICELPGGKELRRLQRGPGNIDTFLRALSYSKDGNLLVVCGEEYLMGLNPNDATHTFDWKEEDDEFASMSQLFAGDTRLATADTKGAIKIWDLTTGKSRKLDSQITCKITKLAVSPNGKLLAAVPLYGRLEIYDVESGKQKRVLDSAGGWRPAVFLHDNISLAYSTRNPWGDTGADRCPYVIENVEMGRQTHLLHGHVKECDFGICLLPDGSKLATVSEDRTIKIWNVKKLP